LLEGATIGEPIETRRGMLNSLWLFAWLSAAAFLGMFAADKLVAFTQSKLRYSIRSLLILVTFRMYRVGNRRLKYPKIIFSPQTNCAVPV
jgi:hypothetical protein